MFGEYHRRTESPKQCLQRHLSGMFVNTGVAWGSPTRACLLGRIGYLCNLNMRALEISLNMIRADHRQKPHMP